MYQYDYVQNGTECFFSLAGCTVGFRMLFWRLVLLGMLYLSLSFGQLRENNAQQRFARSVVNMDDMLNLEDDLVSNVEKLAEALARKAKTIKW